MHWNAYTSGSMAQFMYICIYMYTFAVTGYTREIHRDYYGPKGVNSKHLMAKSVKMLSLREE